MKRVYTTANGKRVSMDAIIAQNEDTIAVGNMKVNARGDQLGPGGAVETPKSKLMADYYKLNTPVAVDNPPVSHKKEVKKDLLDDWVEPAFVQENTTTPETPAESKPKLRGSLADSVAKNKPQEKEEPKKTGPTRI
jgi:hypothetical protein